MQTILDSLRIVLSIRNTITVNALINGIRHIPIIGKHIPETIYRVRAVKIIALIVSIQIELLRAFFGKFLIRKHVVRPLVLLPWFLCLFLFSSTCSALRPKLNMPYFT